jgi:hypothetical protein
MLLCVKTDDVEDYLTGFLHAFEWNEFHFAVEVMAAGEDVRARESHE